MILNIFKAITKYSPSPVFLSTVLLIAGCASTGEARVPVEDRSAATARPVTPRNNAPVTETGSTSGVRVRTLASAPSRNWKPIEPPPPQPAPEEDPETVAGDFNPAVITLLNKANEQARVGHLDQSAASLERALRIEPGNAWLWHRLALVRLFQQRHEEAISLAAKSNTRAEGKRRLQADNWRLIAQAREAMGQQAEARSAAERAKRLSR